MENFFENFLEKGYCIQKVENFEFLEFLQTKLKEKLNCNKLENIHHKE